MKNKTSNLMFLLLIVLVFVGMIFPFLPFDEWNINISFHLNRPEMESIAAELFSQEQTILIENDNSYWTESEKEHLKKAYAFLRKENYEYIHMYGNTVFFCKKISFFGYDGIAYTCDGRFPQSNRGRIYSKQLADNWYYCSID